MAKLSKIFRLSEEAVAILDNKDNATKFVEDLILRQAEHISKGEALILDRLEELSVFSRLPDDGESHPIRPDIKNNSGASPNINYKLTTTTDNDQIVIDTVANLKADSIRLNVSGEGTPSERLQWVSAGTRKGLDKIVGDVFPCCLNKTVKCKHWDWDGLLQTYTNRNTGEVMEAGVE
jgi:hypothetical protein